MIREEEMDEFVAFCKDHTMNEIIAKHGISGKNKVYHSDFPIPFKKAPKHLGEQTMLILNDLRNGLKQSAVARKYGVSRQYVSKLKIVELKDGELC